MLLQYTDPSDDSSSNECSLQSKGPGLGSYGASSNSSHHSDEDSSEMPSNENDERLSTKRKHSKNSNLRATKLSRSSLSENCSSPNDNQYDDIRPGLRDNDTDEENIRSTFQMSNDTAFYNKPDNFTESSSYNSEYSEVSKKLMTSMGHKPGKGLGKFEHGRVEPVEASTQKGRRGLGLKPSVLGEVPQDLKWSPDESTPEAKEEITWMPTPPEEPISAEVLKEWLRKGEKKLTLADETDFVEPHILKGVLNSKSIFDNLDGEDMRNARTRSNPYETIGSVIFLNRAAVKMANMDAMVDFAFTNPKTQDGQPVLGNTDLLYFADVCAGPGGFSEYVLFRKGWRAKGFGFTLQKSNDFKLNDFYAGAPDTFNPYYGVKEDGNIFEPANLDSLKDYVLKQTDDKGVHFLMADGGFSVEGQELIQEILSKQLYLCQCLAALMLVRTGGHFVVKLFDIFTHFSVGLVYIMYRCFEKVSIFKPVTSRPANSERYLICMWKKYGTESVERHLFSVNSILWNGSTEDDDIIELVPLSVLQEDKKFFDYIYKSNCVIGEKQIKNLLKIAKFCKNKNLKEQSQVDMKIQCLELWQLPNQVRKKPERLTAEETLLHAVAQAGRAHEYSFKRSVLGKAPRALQTATDLTAFFPNVYDWHFAFLSNSKGSPDLRIFIACGGKQVFQLEGDTWKRFAKLNITLPANTLLYGEIAREYRGQGKQQHCSKALHVIDAMMLGGTDISSLSLTERINQCNIFCNALEKPNDTQNLPIRCKRFFNLESFSSAIAHLEYREMKRVPRALTLDIPKRGDRNGMFYDVASLLFIKEIKEPWAAKISKTYNWKYYYNVGPDRKPQSVYEIPDEAKLNMVDGYIDRVIWDWESPAIFEGLPEVKLSKIHMEQHISGKL